MKVIALIGSNRGDRSTSASLVCYLEQQLHPHKIPIIYHYARKIYRRQESLVSFIEDLQTMTNEDLLLICAPNYVDSLPAPLIYVLEETREQLGPDGLAGKKLLAVIHSGYPEVQQRRPCIQSCRLFGMQMGMEWWGGFGFGGSSPIAGQPLESAGPFGKSIRPVLERAAEKIASGSLSATDNLILEDKSTIPISAGLMKTIMNILTKVKAFKEKQDLPAKPFRQQ